MDIVVEDWGWCEHFTGLNIQRFLVWYQFTVSLFCGHKNPTRVLDIHHEKNCVRHPVDILSPLEEFLD